MLGTIILRAGGGGVAGKAINAEPFYICDATFATNSWWNFKVLKIPFFLCLPTRLEIQLRLCQPRHDQGPPPCSVQRRPRGPVRPSTYDPVRLHAKPGKAGTQNGEHFCLLAFSIPSSFWGSEQSLWKHCWWLSVVCVFYIYHPNVCCCFF